MILYMTLCVFMSTPLVLFIVLQIQLTEERLVRLVGLQDVCSLKCYYPYLGVEEHIRDKVSLNCHRVAKDCFIEVVG